MTKSRILLSAITAGILVSAGLADSGIKWQNTGTGWQECGGTTPCDPNKHNAGLYSDTADANDQTVTIDTEHTIVYGGRSIGADKNANDNTVTLNKGAEVKGEILGGYSENGNADGNTVILNEGAKANYVKGGFSSNGSANNNIVIINGAEVTLGIVAGGAITETKDNVVVYKSGSVSGGIYGGYGAGAHTGNQLIIAGKGLSAQSVNSFQEYFFALPTDINPNDTMLKLTNRLYLHDQKIGVATQGELKNLKKGDKVTLIDGVTADSFKPEMYDENLKVKHEDTAKLIDTSYAFELTQEETKLNAKLLGKKSKSNEKAKSLAEGSAAAAATIIEAGSVMADKGISAAMNQANANASAGKTIDNFGAIGFGSSRYKTGSYVDSKSINISVGVALGQEVKYGKLLVGPFIELGYSDYETHNDFSSGHVKGDGKSKYLGGGIFARYDWNTYANGHPYIESSIRFGRNKNSFDSSDLDQNYKSNAFYYGAHFGLGYIVEFQNNSNLDFYAKYFYTHLNSDDVTTNQGAKLNLEALNSHKTRFGARYNHALNNSNEWQIKPYVGLAWEHEYKGDANAKNSGYAIDAPSLEGSSGLAEIGVNIGKEKGLSADLGVAGYAGKRRGVAGNIMIKYEF